MLGTIGHEQILMVGFSRTLTDGLSANLPPGSIVVIEDPTILANRSLQEIAERMPVISRLITCEYHRPDVIEAYLNSHPGLVGSVRAVVPGIEYAVEAAARAADFLGRPGPGIHAATVFRNKALQRKIAATAGVRNPVHQLVEDKVAAAAFFDEAGVSCVLKPTRRQAGLGVQLISDRTQLAQAFDSATSVDEPLLVPEAGIHSDILIEHAVSGDEFSVEALIAAGEAKFVNVTAKSVLPGPFPVEIGHVVPASISSDLANRLTELTLRLGRAARFETGILHCEWIVDRDGAASLVECAARMPGDEIATLISLAYGFSLPHAYLLILSGESVELPQEAVAGASIRFVLGPVGRVVTVVGVQDARQLPGVHEVKLSVAAGDRIGTVRSSWDRAGHVIAVGSGPDQAMSFALDAVNHVHVQSIDDN